MIFRILSLSLYLLKKDKNGVRNYIHVKEHIAKNKPTLVLFIVTLFLLGLLISSNLRNFELIRDLEYTTKKISHLENKITEIESDLSISNAKLRIMSDNQTDCTPSSPKKPVEVKRSKSIITRKLVIDLLNDIQE